jgi:arginyl-tRNA synthetase
MHLSDSKLHKIFAQMFEEVKDKKFGKSDKHKGQTIVVEYLDPNPFKEIHIGHAYSGTIGDCIAGLVVNSGGDVSRVTYQGDVGLHVAKAIYGILTQVDGDIDKIEAIKPEDRPKFLGETYAKGAKAFEEEESAKAKIYEINKKIYEKSDELINKIQELGKTWSLSYFDEVYEQFGFTPFKKNYLEGAVAHKGAEIVKDHIKDGIFTESDGAIIFKGEKYGLHTRVFINSLGLPTYEAKDLGNAMLKWEDYKYDKSIIITAEEQAEYFKVMLKALEQFAPEQANRTTHIAHGMVKLPTGKMSSRTGEVVKATDLFDYVVTDLLKVVRFAAHVEASKKLPEEEEPSLVYNDVALGAIKYAFLKNRIGSDVVYDIEESVNLFGNSGPYLQYAHARACSILSKKQPPKMVDYKFDIHEKQLVLKIWEYTKVIQKATDELKPHHICTYLYELAQVFNRFYENDRVIGSGANEPQRLSLVSAYAGVLEIGLNVLNIPAPERM